jgi:CheY-like chemotaxis protein
MSDIPLVIFAEDDDEDWLLISEVLAEECKAEIRVERVRDGRELLKRLKDGRKNKPHLVMLDIKMPRMGGIEALLAMRESDNTNMIPVVIMTTSQLEEDIVRSYKSGANSYVVKPVDHKAMSTALRTMHSYWNGLVSIPKPV